MDKTVSHHIFLLPFSYENKERIIKNFTKVDTSDIPYNEQAYFHKFFIESMFKKCEIYESTDYKTLKMKKSKLYELEVEKISLRVFDQFHVGLLAFHIENKKYDEIRDILEINDYTRRIYPEYFDENGKCSIVADFIELDDLKEDFSYHPSPKISSIITSLIGEITPAVDDRMFTISFYENEELAEKLKKEYLHEDEWYEYVFIDGNGKTVQDKQMQTTLLQKATYSRWKDYGTMYGMSKYSFVCLAESDFPLLHMKTMYFSMFSLLLMVRATLLRFSNEVSAIANKIDKKDITENVNKLYEEYIQFVNSYYFREITAKDQGMELYEQALETLKIPRDIKDLDAEIEELHRYVEMKQEKAKTIENEKTNKKLEKIQIWGGYLLFASVLTGFFGMNVGQENSNFSWLIVGLSIAASIIAAKILFSKED